MNENPFFWRGIKTHWIRINKPRTHLCMQSSLVVFQCEIYAIECNSVFTVMICTNLWRENPFSSEMCRKRELKCSLRNNSHAKPKTSFILRLPSNCVLVCVLGNCYGLVVCVHHQLIFKQKFCVIVDKLWLLRLWRIRLRRHRRRRYRSE